VIAHAPPRFPVCGARCRRDTMDPERTKKLLEEAAERYNEGSYEEAITHWRKVLAEDPSNQKAREGIRMASLLTTDFHSHPAGADEEAAGAGHRDDAATRARVEAGRARVRELAEAGDIASALEGCALLSEIAPDLPEVKELTARLRRQKGAAKPADAGDIHQHL